MSFHAKLSCLERARPLKPVIGARIASDEVDRLIGTLARRQHGVVARRQLLDLDGIPATTVPRTLFDLAAVLPPARAERAISEAEVHGRTDSLSLGDLLERYPERPGNETIRAVLADRKFGANITHSELEVMFLDF
jgi:hypothetical protein